MKKGSGIMLVICALSLTMVIGIFVGRNMNSGYACLPINGSERADLPVGEMTDYRLDLNTATKTQLMELPGIGEKIADRIITYRSEIGKFSSTDDLMDIEGIGEKKLQQIENLIKVGG